MAAGTQWLVELPPERFLPFYFPSLSASSVYQCDFSPMSLLKSVLDSVIGRGKVPLPVKQALSPCPADRVFCALVGSKYPDSLLFPTQFHQDCDCELVS